MNNNEETIIMKPQNSNMAEQSQNAETAEKKSDKGKKAAATAAAAVAGGVAGAGATYAATEMLHGNEAGEQKPEEEAQATEDPAVAAAVDTQEEQPQDEVAANVDDSAYAGPDYTGHHGADLVTPNPEVHAAANEDGGTAAPEVQVLGVYEAQGEQGQTMQAAVLTNGQEVGTVIDANGDGTADVLVVGYNHDPQIDEGEVYDISDQHVQMSDLQDSYLAQQQMQQEQMQQEHDTFAYNTGDDQQDYNNNADMSLA